jgi:hypothetical protein
MPSPTFVAFPAHKTVNQHLKTSPGIISLSKVQQPSVKIARTAQFVNHQDQTATENILAFTQGKRRRGEDDQLLAVSCKHAHGLVDNMSQQHAILVTNVVQHPATLQVIHSECEKENITKLSKLFRVSGQ